ncbi:unnamed protein product [Pelagomonas calceolata]|uniref:Uncharacterized protein n=1 Tax=Pelagomonas calceolata TaxID=35677 RepID=A0A8J2X4Y6_9STRA|nr:unnamed protein product [Pelagomonas calceolata]
MIDNDYRQDDSRHAGFHPAKAEHHRAGRWHARRVSVRHRRGWRMVLQRKWQASRGAEERRGVGCAPPTPPRRQTRARTRDDDAATLLTVAASDTLPARRYGAGVQAIPK